MILTQIFSDHQILDGHLFLEAQVRYNRFKFAAHGMNLHAVNSSRRFLHEH